MPSNFEKTEKSGQISFSDLTFFCETLVLYNEITGYADAAATNCSESVYDVGVTDSGMAGSVVVGSTLSYSSMSKVHLRSSALSIPSGDSIISQIGANPAPGNCMIIGPTLVIGF